MKSGDTMHVLQNAELKRCNREAEPKLCRFKNDAGDSISAVYLDDFEYWWTYTDNEEQMIRGWNSRDAK